MNLRAMWTNPRDPKQVEPVVVVGFMGNDDRFSLVVVRADGKISKVNKMDVRVDMAALEGPRIGVDRTVVGTSEQKSPSQVPGGFNQVPQQDVEDGELSATTEADDEHAERVAAAKEYKAQQEREKKLAKSQAKT